MFARLGERVKVPDTGIIGRYEGMAKKQHKIRVSGNVLVLTRRTPVKVKRKQVKKHG
jgi:hypothetical protein